MDLQKLADVPEFGVAFLNELITTHVKDTEEAHCWPFLERVALRNLEELVVSNQIDSDVIPLLKALIGQDISSVTKGSSVKQRFNKELVLRVQTEVVLSVLREDVNKGERDWSSFASELERVFTEEADNGVLDRKRELSALLKPKNQTEAVVAAYFNKYCLKKLKDDLYTFIDEKKKSFKPMFLDQLLRDFLSSNGTPFPEELGDVKKFRKVDTHANQAHVDTVNLESLPILTGALTNANMNPQNVEHEAGNGLEFDKTGDENIVHGRRGRKRLRRKVLSANHDIGDDEPEEMQEHNPRIKKPRRMISTSPVHSETVLHQDVSELALSKSISLKDNSPAKHRAESLEQRSSLKRGKEGMSASGNFGLKSMRCCTPHVSASMEKSEAYVGEPGRTNKCLSVADVESDAETQVMKGLSTDGEEGNLIKRSNGDDHLKEMAESSSHSESGSDQGDSQKIVATGVVKKKTLGSPSQRSISVDRRKKAPVLPSEDKIAQQRDIEKFLIKNEFIPLDAQDIYKFEFLDVGDDGHEDVCHMCGLHGKLVCCDRCPISMHFTCTEVLDLRLPKDEEEWYCPICVFTKAAQVAAEANKVAAAAKEKLKTFMKESIKKQSSSEGDALHQLRQKKTQSENIEQERTGNENIRQKKSKSLRKNGAGSVWESSVKCLLFNEDAKKTERAPNTPDQNISRRRLLAESTSGQKTKEKEISARPSKSSGPKDDSGEERVVQEAGVQELGSGAGDSRKVGGDKHDGDLDEDGGEKLQNLDWDRFLSGRRKLPGFRRRPLPWTREEEDALMEGVRRISNNGEWGFHWKRILQFGKGRFDPSRTYGDLKDKWRNLSKGVS